MGHIIDKIMKNYSVLVTVIAIILFSMIISGQTFAADRLELDETSIVGSKELPKVLYIVPWKDTTVGSMASATPDNSSNKGMRTLDREVFQRELQYFGMLQGSGNLSQK